MNCREELLGYSFSAEELYAVCDHYVAGMLASIEAVPLDFEPSAAHRNAIQRLIDGSLRKGKRHALYRRVAAIAAAAIILFGTVMVTNVHAREAVVRWMRLIFPDYVLYRFFGEPDDDISRYTIGWIPDGLELVDYYESPTLRVFHYQSDEEGFTISFTSIEDGVIIEIGDTEYLSQEVFVNGLKADLYIDIYDQSKNLVWVTQNGSTEIDIEGTISTDLMFQIAESINPQ
ncbi:MAG: DUF4367 domain-containing protein [Firmicutes bacterium]|nr:DUF4367 domain-containing protein [Bacillota bacterium]